MSNASSKTNKKNRESRIENREETTNSQFPIPNSTSEASLGGPVRVIFGTFVIFILSQVVAALIVEIGKGILGISTPIMRSAGQQFVYVLLTESVVVAAVVWLARRRGISLLAIGLRRKLSWRDIKWAASAFFIFYTILIVAMLILIALIPSFDVNDPQNVGFNYLSSRLDNILAFLALVILAPIGEETLMRGYLYSGLRRIWKFLPALLTTSFLFGVAHLSTGVKGALWAAGVTTFILSVVLVYVREKTGALYAPILVHSLNNLVAFFAYFHS